MACSLSISARGEPGACHVEPDLQPDYSMFAVGRPAEFERVGLCLPCPEFEDQSEVVAVAC
jgi:hypothetical protein